VEGVGQIRGQIRLDSNLGSAGGCSQTLRRRSQTTLHFLSWLMSTSTSFKNRNLLAVIGDEVLVNVVE
jgi:hypothetical protein